MSPEEIAAALAMVNELQVRDAIDDLERAAGWIVVSVCPEFGTMAHTGPFENPGDALGYAAKWERELNIDGDPELPYKVQVLPIFEPEEMLR